MPLFRNSIEDLAENQAGFSAGELDAIRALGQDISHAALNPGSAENAYLLGDSKLNSKVVSVFSGTGDQTQSATLENLLRNIAAGYPGAIVVDLDIEHPHSELTGAANDEGVTDHFLYGVSAGRLLRDNSRIADLRTITPGTYSPRIRDIFSHHGWNNFLAKLREKYGPVPLLLISPDIDNIPDFTPFSGSDSLVILPDEDDVNSATDILDKIRGGMDTGGMDIGVLWTKKPMDSEEEQIEEQDQEENIADSGDEQSDLAPAANEFLDDLGLDEEPTVDTLEETDTEPQLDDAEPEEEAPAADEFLDGLGFDEEPAGDTLEETDTEPQLDDAEPEEEAPAADEFLDDLGLDEEPSGDTIDEADTEPQLDDAEPEEEAPAADEFLDGLGFDEEPTVDTLEETDTEPQLDDAEPEEEAPAADEFLDGLGFDEEPAGDTLDKPDTEPQLDGAEPEEETPAADESLDGLGFDEEPAGDTLDEADTEPQFDDAEPVEDAPPAGEFLDDLGFDENILNESGQAEKPEQEEVTLDDHDFESLDQLGGLTPVDNNENDDNDTRSNQSSDSPVEIGADQTVDLPDDDMDEFMFVDPEAPPPPPKEKKKAESSAKDSEPAPEDLDEDEFIIPEALLFLDDDKEDEPAVPEPEDQSELEDLDTGDLPTLNDMAEADDQPAESEILKAEEEIEDKLSETPVANQAVEDKPEEPQEEITLDDLDELADDEIIEGAEAEKLLDETPEDQQDSNIEEKPESVTDSAMDDDILAENDLEDILPDEESDDIDQDALFMDDDDLGDLEDEDDDIATGAEDKPATDTGEAMESMASFEQSFEESDNDIDIDLDPLGDEDTEPEDDDLENIPAAEIEDDEIIAEDDAEPLELDHSELEELDESELESFEDQGEEELSLQEEPEAEVIDLDETESDEASQEEETALDEETDFSAEEDLDIEGLDDDDLDVIEDGEEQESQEDDGSELLELDDDGEPAESGSESIVGDMDISDDDLLAAEDLLADEDEGFGDSDISSDSGLDDLDISLDELGDEESVAETKPTKKKKSKKSSKGGIGKSLVTLVLILMMMGGLIYIWQQGMVSGLLHNVPYLNEMLSGLTDKQEKEAATDETVMEQETIDEPLTPPEPVKEYPKMGYSVQLGSFRFIDRAIEVSKTLEQNGLGNSYIVPLFLDSLGNWNRLYMGSFKSEQEAQAALNSARNLLGKNDLSSPIVKSTPYAIHVGDFSSRAALDSVKNNLMDNLIPSYTVEIKPDSGEVPAFRLFVGAFEDQKQALRLRDRLFNLGLDANIVERRGGTKEIVNLNGAPISPPAENEPDAASAPDGNM